MSKNSIISLAFVLLAAVASILFFKVQQTEKTSQVQQVQLDQTQITAKVKLAQSISTKCSTSTGTCYVSPAPVGSPCSCNGVPGSIIH